MQKVIVGRSRIKTFLLLLGAIAFVLIGIWMITTSGTDVLEKVIGGISILFFGAAIPIGIKKLITNEPALELSENHLIIEPQSNKKFVLPWNIILEFDVINIKSTKIITIKVSNPKDWIDKETNPIKRKLMQFNLNSYGTPFNIASSGLDISHKKLMELLDNFLKKNNS